MDTILIEIERGCLRQVTVGKPIKVLLLDHDDASDDYQLGEFVDVVVDAHRLHSLTGGVLVESTSANELLDWPLHHETLDSALIDHAWQEARQQGLITPDNEDRAYIIFEFADGHYHCYVEYEECLNR